MPKIDHPLFGIVGAFWIAGVPTPFYSLADALKHQREHGGDILNFNGKLLYPEPQSDEENEAARESLSKDDPVKTKEIKSAFSRFLDFVRG